MAYLSPAQLVDGPGRLTELAEVFGLDEALLRATIDGADRTAYEPEDIALADAALATITAELAQADQQIDARLTMRGYALPVDADAFPIVRTWARAIARYELHPQRERTDDGQQFRIERDYRNVITALEQVAAGKLSLGAGDVIAAAVPSTPVGPTAVAPPRVWDRTSLADY